MTIATISGLIVQTPAGALTDASHAKWVIIVIGAALSTSLAGLVVVHAGFSAAFLVLAGIAASGLLLCFFGMLETRGLDATAATAIAQRALSR